MQSGKTLDPLAIYKNGKEDGRHRAIAAKELGIKQVPVLVWKD
jgi:ParB-like chromosome segregation protein Spo0J